MSNYILVLVIFWYDIWTCTFSVSLPFAFLLMQFFVFFIIKLKLNSVIFSLLLIFLDLQKSLVWSLFQTFSIFFSCFLGELVLRCIEVKLIQLVFVIILTTLFRISIYLNFYSWSNQIKTTDTKKVMLTYYIWVKEEKFIS